MFVSCLCSTGSMFECRVVVSHVVYFRSCEIDYDELCMSNFSILFAHWAEMHVSREESM